MYDDVQFVKFRRGSQAAYDTLVNNNRVDDNTLYFIYDKNNKSDSGSLYLGLTPIISSNGAITAGAIPAISFDPTTEDVQDVLDSFVPDAEAGDMAIANGDLYIYNGTDWEPATEFFASRNMVEELGTEINEIKDIVGYPSEAYPSSSEYVEGAYQSVGTRLTNIENVINQGSVYWLDIGEEEDLIFKQGQR